jgi:hypothetical protein
VESSINAVASKCLEELEKKVFSGRGTELSMNNPVLDPFIVISLSLQVP